MLTVVPDPNELPSDSTLLKLRNHVQKTYTVSVVTFYKRDFNCDADAEVPSERFVGIQFQGTGIGGGDARLLVPSTGPGSMGIEQAEEYLKVRDNQWIMVTGFVREPRLDPLTNSNPPGYRKLAKWYRVIRVDDEIEEDTSVTPNLYTRNITLAGPDWDDSVFDPRATIIDGVIGVYTTTVTLD